jgi:TonB family protein
METGQRIQTETRRDAEEVANKSMRFAITIIVVCIASIDFTNTHNSTPVGVVRDSKNRRVYVLYQPKPDYPIDARERRHGRTGTFLLHFRSNGTVESVEILRSTGHMELDEAAKNALIKWRVRPGPSDTKVPITFKPPNAGRAEWPFAR